MRSGGARRIGEGRAGINDGIQGEAAALPAAVTRVLQGAQRIGRSGYAECAIAVREAGSEWQR